MSEEIAARWVRHGDRDYLVTVVPDNIATPADADCYGPEDVQGWRNGDWRYVGVTVASTGYLDSLWAVELGSLNGVTVTIDDLFSAYPVPDMLGGATS